MEVEAIVAFDCLPGLRIEPESAPPPSGAPLRMLQGLIFHWTVMALHTLSTPHFAEGLVALNRAGRTKGKRAACLKKAEGCRGKIYHKVPHLVEVLEDPNKPETV